MTPVIIHFSLGRQEEKFRLVVRPNEPHLIEVECRDRLMASSWRAAKLDTDMVPRVLAEALMKSQMTPTQRLNQPTMLHPEGIVYMSGECSIDLGRLK